MTLMAAPEALSGSISLTGAKPESSSCSTRTGSTPWPKLAAPVAMLGVAFDKVSCAQALAVVDSMVAWRRPHYIVTANVDFVVQSQRDLELRRILADADLVLCDGMPLVWASRCFGNALPERVAGSDFVPQLLVEAERKGWRVFFLGGSSTSLERAAQRVRAQHPRLQLVGAYSPPFQPLLEMDHDEILRQVRDAKPDILLVAFGCPKQEKWISMHFRQTGVPVSIGVGATIDFLGGAVRRAPTWMQRVGLEWFFRLAQEPRRLFGRYATGIGVFGCAILQQAWLLGLGRSRRSDSVRVVAESTGSDEVRSVVFQAHLDVRAVNRNHPTWTELAAGTHSVIADLSQVRSVDSTGVGLLIRLERQLRGQGRALVLLSPSAAVQRALDLMRFSELLVSAPDSDTAHRTVRSLLTQTPVAASQDAVHGEVHLCWQGEIVAGNVDQVWEDTWAKLGDEVTRCVVNLAAVRFLDSSGASLMVRCRKAAQRKGLSFRFADPSPAVRNVLQLLRLDRSLMD